VISGDSAVIRSAIVIRPTGDDDIGIHVTDPLGVCDNLTIQHVTIDGTGSHSNGQGIFVDDICEPITIRDVEVSGWTGQGILFSDSSDDGAATAIDSSTISTTIVRDNGSTGIELLNGTGNSLDDLDVSGNGAEGIALFMEVNAQVTHSQITSNGSHGLADFEGTNTLFRDSALTGNDGDGFVATGPYNGLRIEDSLVQNNGGVGLQFTTGVFGDGGTDTEITGNLIERNGGDAIHALRHGRLVIAENEILENNGAGIVVDNGADTSIRLNMIARNGDQGVHVLDQIDVEITLNDINANGRDGVKVSRGDDNFVVDNDLTDNGATGLVAADSEHLSVVNNRILGNESLGVALSDNTDTLVQANDISDNGEHGIKSLRELNLIITGNDVRSNGLSGIHLSAGTNGSVVANHEITDNGTVGAVVGDGPYGISMNGETNLLVEKNILRRNFGAQILVNSSSDVAIRKNEIETAVAGIILVDELAHPFVDFVIGGSPEGGNRFRGLDPTGNACDVEANACYIELPFAIVGLGTINARYNDWGTTDPDLIESLICHNTEVPCGGNVIDFSNALDPGDSPAMKDGVPGDVDCSGSVNSIDAAFLLQHTAGLIGSLPCAANADVNGDGNTNSLDAALILQFSAGLISQL
jgi:parallel beta-helix repeat protein